MVTSTSFLTYKPRCLEYFAWLLISQNGVDASDAFVFYVYMNDMPSPI